MLTARFCCWGSGFLNKCYLTWGVLRAESELKVSQAGACLRVCPVINCKCLCLYCAPRVLSLSQADEWLWLVLSFAKWPWEMTAGMFQQTSLYSSVNGMQPSFSATKVWEVKNKKDEVVKHAVYLEPCRIESPQLLYQGLTSRRFRLWGNNCFVTTVWLHVDGHNDLYRWFHCQRGA